MRRIADHLRTLLAFLLGSLIAAATPVVFAADLTVIKACVRNVGGLVRIIGATEQCRINERALSWNQQGPAAPSTFGPLTGRWVGTIDNGLRNPCTSDEVYNIEAFIVEYPGGDLMGSMTLLTDGVPSTQLPAMQLSGRHAGSTISINTNHQFSGTVISDTIMSGTGSYFDCTTKPTQWQLTKVQ